MKPIQIDVQRAEPYENVFTNAGSKGYLCVNGKRAASFFYDDPADDIFFPKIYDSECFLLFQDFIRSWAGNGQPAQMKLLLVGMFLSRPMVSSDENSGLAWLNMR